MKINLTRDSAFQVVLHIRTPTGNNGLTEVGTGLFIVKEEKFLYILTATHVAKGCGRNTEVVISDANGNCVAIPLVTLNAGLGWVHHPIADISVLPLHIDSSLVTTLSGRFFPVEQLDMSGSTPSRDAYLTSVGFPNGLGASGKFSPFTFRSHASSSLITLLRADTKTPANFFTLENPSVGGYSGGPVFDFGYVIVGSMTTHTGPSICHGIMHGTISDSTGGKIAAVTPCYYVKAII